MKKILSQFILAFALMGMVTPAHAILPIPEEPGISGYINVGVGGMSFETNMISGNNLSDTSGNRIDSLTDSADSESNAIPVISFELVYTFDETRTQVFAGNLLEDMLQYDATTLLGLRQELPDKSIVSLAYVFTSLPTSVWEDPYVVNADRRETDRTSGGLRLGFDRILRSKFEVEFTWRDITIDTERSGKTPLQLGLSDTEAALLDRNGPMYSGKLTHPFFFKERRHALIPSLEYTRYDLDGEAMAFDAYGIKLSYGFNPEKISLLTTLYYAQFDFDKENPIYVETREDDTFGASFTAIYKTFLGVPKMSLVGTVATFEGNSNIDFYDTSVSMAAVSVLYRF